MSSSPAEFSSLLLRLYGMAGEVPADAFQDAALAWLKSVLAFDSAMWGTGLQTAAGFDMQTVHLHEQPMAMLESYQAVRHLDTAAVALTRSQKTVRGFHARSWFDRREQAPLRAHGRRFDQANFFISAQGDPVVGAFQWVSLFRADERALCTDQEAALLALLSPHLMQALAVNRKLHCAHLESDPAAGRAICSLRGLYYQRDSQYDALLRTEWGGEPRVALPAPVLTSFLRGAPSFTGRQVIVTGRVEGALLFLTIRARRPLDALGERERLVADLLCDGLTHKEIAQKLGRAPATVRNQVQSIYRKLGVSNRAALFGQVHSRP